MKRLRTGTPFVGRGLYLFVILAAVTAAYYPTFRGEFILDDIPFVKNNETIKSIQPLVSSFLQQDGILGDRVGQEHSGYYRPLTDLSYRVDYALWGMSSVGFRATNLILHLITCVLLFICMGRLLGKSAAPWVAVLLFGIHPANTEAVAWVASRNNLLVTLFSLASFYFHLRGAEDQKSRQSMLSLLFFALALLSKEFAVMLLPVFIVYDRVMHRETGFFRRHWRGYLAFLSVLLGYAILRKAAVPDLVPVGRAIGNLGEALWFSPYLLLENLRIILVPVGLHNFMVGYPVSFLGKEAVLGFAFLALVLTLLWRWRTHRFFVFASVSFLLAQFPVLNLIPTSAYSLISMRWLYFPMIFFSFSVGWLLGRTGTAWRGFLPRALVSVAALYLGLYTYTLNEHLWKTEEDFFRTEVVSFGNHFYAGDLARIHHLRGEYGEAQEYYRKGILSAVSPSRANLLINYAALLIETGRPEDALGHLEEAEKWGPGRDDLGRLWNNKGAALFKMDAYREAVACFEKAVAFAPTKHGYRANLGQAARKTGNHAKAAAEQ